jgi:hypothetical protein
VITYGPAQIQMVLGARATIWETVRRCPVKMSELSVTHLSSMSGEFALGLPSGRGRTGLEKEA